MNLRTKSLKVEYIFLVLSYFLLKVLRMNTEKRKRTIAGGYLRRIKEKEKRGHSTIKRNIIKEEGE